MGSKSRRKGASGEREACAVLAETLGGEWHRTAPMQAGGTGYPDVHSDEHPRLWVEVKRKARPSPLAALKQAEREATEGRVPMALVRADRDEWAVVLRLSDLGQLWSALDGGREDLVERWSALLASRGA